MHHPRKVSSYTYINFVNIKIQDIIYCSLLRKKEKRIIWATVGVCAQDCNHEYSQAALGPREQPSQWHGSTGW